MKKIYIFIFSLIALQTFSQKDYSRYYNSWRLGLNLGAAWQTADYKSYYGGGGGITLEKGFHENKTNIFSFAIRGRYLGANTYGMDFNRNYDVKTNDAYNGKYDASVNYVDTIHTGKNYVYDNYKMTLNEGSLELQMTFNRLRERKHILLNLWGGVGITSFRTKSDLLDANGKMYDFSLVDSTGNQTKALSSYKTILDKKYESNAYGSKAGNIITFSPSAGIGLGYQFSPGFSMLFEYKVTFPQGTNADLLDGKIGTNHDMIAGSNDYYHYTGLNLLFTLRGKKKNTSTSNTDQTVYTNTVVGTNTIAPTNSIVTTNTVVATNTVVTNPPVTDPKPIITYITPATNGLVVTNQQYKISAQILNITNANQIQFKYNGVNYSNFSYNNQTHILEFNANLNVGNNPIQIIATNNVGSDNKSTSVIYELPKPAGTPPVISIINPSSCPYIANSKTYSFRAIVANVASKSNVSLKINNYAVTNFGFNTVTGQLDLTLNLNEGVNNIEVSAFNNFGNDLKNCSISYTTPKQVGTPPLVTYINPPQPGYVTTSSSYVINAQVLNVVGQNSVSVYYNGMSTPFTYNASTKMVSFTANLNVGSNSISITANNTVGEDTKETSVIYKENKVSGPPPIVSLINPALEMNSTNNLLYNFKLSVLNVASKNDIVLTFNGNVNPNFTYNATSKQVDFSSNLNVGDNTLILKGTNAFGVDSKTVHVNYMPFETAKHPPLITFTNPVVSPASFTQANYMFKADVKNITSSTQMVVKYNGTVITNYTFNPPLLVYSALLVNGNNFLEITATNNDGSDTKNVIVNYKPKAAPGNPPVVSLVSPQFQMNATDNLLYNFKLSVLNVNSQADIELMFNGVAQSNFTYNTVTKEVFFQTNLIVGDNTVTVKGTNSFGTDSKIVHVNYTPHADLKLPPVVTITNPAVSPSNVSSPNYVFKATVANMPNTSGIVVKYNGVAITNYTYDGFNITFPTALVQGNNSFEVTATNNDGSDMKTAIVNYRMKVASGNPPIVSLVSPQFQMNATDNLLYNFKLSVLNVNSQADIELLFNGVAQSSFTYNAVTKEVFFQTNLVVGNNTVIVKGTNSFGIDSKTVNVNYTPHVDVKLPPVITFMTPLNLSASTQASSYVYAATITNMANAGNLVVKFNGTLISNYAFNGVNFSYNALLNLGANSLEITATNNDGTDVKTAVVTYKQKVVAKPPVVTILNPVGNPTVNVSSYNFKFNALNVTQNQIEVTLNGNQITSYNFVSTQGDFTANLNQGQNTLVVKATNVDGTSTKSENVMYVVETNTISVTTPTTDPSSTRTITICHIPPGNPQNPQTIHIPLSAWPAHQAHGDVMGTCVSNNTVTTPTASTSSETITICHSPIGSNQAPETMVILLSDWAIHKAHGDLLGECTPTTTPVSTPTTSANTPTATGTGSNSLANQVVTICHTPPGNGQKSVTIDIPLAAWPAHQAHGDVMGACPSEKVVPVKNTPKTIPSIKPTTDTIKEVKDSIIKPSITPRKPR